MISVELVGKNIYLLPTCKGGVDAENIVRWRNEKFVNSHFIYRQQFTVQSQEKWYETMVDTGKAAQFIIYLKEQKKPIGCVYLKDIDRTNNKAEYGIFIGEKNYLGKGFGSEAAYITLQYGFGKLQLHKIYLKVFSINKRAQQSYKKVGFVQEGYFRDEVRIENQYYDIVFMSILKEDFNMANEEFM